MLCSLHGKPGKEIRIICNTHKPLQYAIPKHIVRLLTFKKCKFIPNFFLVSCQSSLVVCSKGIANAKQCSIMKTLCLVSKVIQICIQLMIFGYINPVSSIHQS